MKDTNYFSVQAWMVTKLHLKGVERDVYAILYGFTQDNESECRCSYTYMSTITGYTKRGIIDAINRLEAKHLIVKSGSDSEKDTRNIYKCNFDVIDGVLVGGEPNSPEGGEPDSPGGEPNSPADDVRGEPDSPHNIRDINKININNKEKNTGAGVSSKISHSRGFRREKQSLEDKLFSGEEIASQKKERKKSPKDKFRDECLDIIDKEYSDETKKLLIEYFNFVTKVPEDKDNLCKRVKTTKLWRNKLDRLDDLVKDGYDCNKVIQQSLDKKQYVFYPLQSVNKKATSGETLSGRLTGTDLEEARERIQQAIDDGEEIF